MVQIDQGDPCRALVQCNKDVGQAQGMVIVLTMITVSSLGSPGAEELSSVGQQFSSVGQQFPGLTTRVISWRPLKNPDAWFLIELIWGVAGCVPEPR